MLCALPPLAWLNHAAMKVLLGALMLPVAYGVRRMSVPRRLLRTALVFFALSMCAAGAVTAAGLLGGGTAIGSVSLRLLIIAFGVCYIAVTLVFRRAARGGQRSSEIKIELGERSVTLRALVDTGNSLTDPLSGAHVCIVCIDDLAPLLPADIFPMLEAAVKSGSPDKLILLNRGQESVKFRLIPYSAVGVRAGMLVGFRPAHISVDGRERRDLVIAVSPNEVTDNVTYSALI